MILPLANVTFEHRPASTPQGCEGQGITQFGEVNHASLRLYEQFGPDMARHPVWRSRLQIVGGAEWALPPFLCTSWRRATGCCGRVRQHSSAEEIEAGASIHLTLDRLEAIDLAFDLAGAPLCIHGCDYRR
jgi:hypothetical protein